MKTKKKTAQDEKTPPGKEKAPKPQPGTPTKKPAGADDSSAKPEDQEPEGDSAHNEIIAPDGEPELKKEPPPLF